MKRIKYKFLAGEINHGTEDAPDIEQVILNKQITCTDESLEDTLVHVLQEALDGEYTVEDAELESGDALTQEERIANLEEALDLLLSGETE